MGLKKRSTDSAEPAAQPVHRETWVSTNKILNSSLSAKRMNSRNPNFDYDETKLLISLWGDPQVQKTLITTHKKHPVIAELALKMREFGYNRSTEEINTRIKNLKCFYNRIKKDMAAGIINQTTWKHFSEMDEIISRPVFGNAHRLHMMQQQKQQQEEEELKKQILEQQEQMQRFPVKLELMSDDDSTEIRAEDLLTIDTNPPDESLNALEKNELNIKDDSKNNYEEDDDDDDDEDDDSDFDVENEFNDGLDELLSKAKATTSNTTPASEQPSAATRLTPKPTSVSESVTITSATSSPASSQGKISVVPTNLLLKPTPANVSISSPIQIYTQPTVTLAKPPTLAPAPQGVITSSSSAAGMAPMKLLLVNTVSKDGTTQQILTPASEVPKMPQMRPAPMLAPKPTVIPIAPKPPTVSIPAINVPQASAPDNLTTAGRNPKPVLLNGEKSSSVKALLNQLVSVQRENLTVSKARLALEKERLQFEKQIGGPLVDVVRSLSSFFNGFMQQHQKTNAAAREESGQPSAKKRRTENSADKQQQPAVTTTEAIKAEVISDTEEN
ncbi:histone-lysine N-methyltransferase SETD1A [Wyeomyia smithii]|uniref:histone-lysine N-methyltransferase SETD1A n=1 Tax=Wyeomyia smithii TaxID=174621 RepID=UPI00246802EF|nr:histone-lysine N-methyltransferase SETD1A [Wyeomyia smithii]